MKKKTLAHVGLAAFAVIPAIALAQAAGLNPDDANSVIDAVLDAIRHGRTDLAAVLALILVVAVVRKGMSKVKLSAIESDIGGTLLNFLLVAGVMLAGQMSAGDHLSIAMLKNAAIAAFATAGGFTTVKRIVAEVLPVFEPVIKSALGGWSGIVEWFVKKWTGSGDEPPTDPPGDAG